MAVDIDKFMDGLITKTKPKYDTVFTRWLVGNGWEFKENDSNKSYDYYYNNKMSIFITSEYLKAFRAILRSINTIDLPPEATDEECIEIVKRLMEEFK